MTTYIALLRGINVGGHRKILMADLRAVFIAAGGDNVTTYIQSGNVVFGHSARSPKKLVAELEQMIESATGFAVPVILRTTTEWASVITDNPYPHAEPTSLHVAFLAAAPDPGAAERIDRANFAPEDFIVQGREIYLHLPNGMGRAKLPSRMGPLMAPATVRNWRTVEKLFDLAEG